MSPEEWLAVNAARAARALANPEIRAEVLRLVSDDDEEARRRRRKKEAEQELSTLEWRLRLSDFEDSEAAEQA